LRESRAISGLRPENRSYARFASEGGYMVWTIVLILFVLWALGLVGGYAFGGLIHLLLAVALIVVVVRLVQGRRVS